MNIYVPRGGEPVIDRLNRVVSQLHRNKNQVVLEALEAKVIELESQLGRTAPPFQAYPIGAGDFSREDLYQDRI